jgi:predicted RNA-binding Zn-ribbon protein involved in translation (DUF1610 family)
MSLMPRRPKYTTEMLEQAARESLSISELMVRLGLRLSGGGHSHIKRRLTALGIETSHFLGSRTNSGIRHTGGPAKKAPHEWLVLRSPHQPALRAEHVRRALQQLGRPYRCEGCGLGPEWNGRPLVLHVDHINDLHHDYTAENLRFLCPNCHAQAKTFGTLNRAYAEVA